MAVRLLYCMLSGQCMLLLDVLGEELVEEVVSSCHDMLPCYLAFPTEKIHILRMSLCQLRNTCANGHGV